MDIRRLEVFCRVVELKSFTRAADAVLLSQPTVSEHIRSLEEEIGQRLVDRLGREALPTQAGRILYRYGQKMLQLRQEALQSMESHGGRLAGRLHLGAGTIPGTYLLPRLLGRFRGEHPGIKATLRIAGSQLIAQEVLGGELELGVVGASWHETGLDWQEIFSDTLSLVVPPTHPWAGREAIPLDELSGAPFVLRERASGTRRAVGQLLDSHGFNPALLQEVAEMGSTEAVKQAVKAGLGVAILSCRAVAEEVQAGLLACVPLEGIEMRRPFYLIRRKRRELAPACAAFLELLLEEARLEGATFVTPEETP
ncbi:MAG: LysR family transcriptional regulator [Desulfobulbaceae bacterium A2]|nr:MAG: LysR family transcriptional regulator [Desulfobulbaceae bacterium A2]